MILLPHPRRLIRTDGQLHLPRAGLIQLLSTPTDLLPAPRVLHHPLNEIAHLDYPLAAGPPPALPPPARALQPALNEIAHLDYPLVAGGPDAGVVIDLLLANHLPHDQGYELEIEPHGIHLTAATPEGAFWAVQTLIQILRQ